jgi:hypothetical protein
MLRQIAGGGVVVVAVVLSLAAACSSTVAPSPSPSRPAASWPNEPAGMTVVADWGFDQAPPLEGDVPIPGSPGWSVVYGLPPDPSHGTVQLVTDPGAPLSGPHVYDVIYPEGMVEGLAPTTVYYPRSASGLQKMWGRMSGTDGGLGSPEAYVGLWWKPSAPFDYGPNGNKIAFLFNGGGATGGQQFLILMPDGRLHVLPEYPGDYRWRRPNVNATVVALGVWHRIEWHSNIRTGTLEWWLDGVLQGRYTDVTNTYDFDVFKLSPTWGGNTGARKRETDHYWFDHVRLSVR